MITGGKCGTHSIFVNIGVQVNRRLVPRWILINFFNFSEETPYIFRSEVAAAYQ
jgi:hypothetical protein